MPDNAILVQIADSVTAEMNTALAETPSAFPGLEFVAERSYADFEDEELEDIDCLKVDVIPVTYEEGSDLDARESVDFLCPIDIAVRKKFGPCEEAQNGRIDQAEFDRLVLFMQQIYLRFCKFTTTIATWNKTVMTVCWSRSHMRKHRMFLGVIRVTFECSEVL